MADAPTLGIYAYTRSLDDTFGGVEANVSQLSRHLAAEGFRVVVHCLADRHGGWHVADGELRRASRLKRAGERISVFHPVNGPGIEGCVEENVACSRGADEQLILAFGTRDGFVFDLAIAAAEELELPLVSFVYFTREERWFRQHVVSRTRSIAGAATEDEWEEGEQRSVATLDRVLAASARVLVPTHFVRGQLSATCSPETMSRVRVLYHGIDEAIFGDPAPWDPDGPWLHVSRLAVPYALHKNFLWSCRLLAEARDEFPNARLVVCGDGDGTGLIREMADDHGVGDRVDVVGFQTQQRLAQHYRDASVLLVPSMMEAGSSVTVEAVLAGCLPVALDLAGSAEVLDTLGLDAYLVPGREASGPPDGLLVEPCIDAAISVLTRARDDPARTTADLATARAIAQRRFSLAATCGRLVERLRQDGLL